jgi:hypothetical protein
MAQFYINDHLTNARVLGSFRHKKDAVDKAQQLKAATGKDYVVEKVEIIHVTQMLDDAIAEDGVPSDTLDA